MVKLQILLMVCLSLPIRKVFGLEVWTFSEAFSFIRLIPAPVSTKNLALPPSLRCSTIDNNPVVVQLTLNKLPLGSPVWFTRGGIFPWFANGKFRK